MSLLKNVFWFVSGIGFGLMLYEWHLNRELQQYVKSLGMRRGGDHKSIVVSTY